MFPTRLIAILVLVSAFWAVSAAADDCKDDRPFFVDVIRYGWHSGRHYAPYKDFYGRTRVGMHSGLHKDFYVVSVAVTREEYERIVESERREAVRERSEIRPVVPRLENAPRVPLTTLGNDPPMTPRLENTPRVPLRNRSDEPSVSADSGNTPRVPHRGTDGGLPDVPRLEKQPRAPLRTVGRSSGTLTTPRLENQPRVPLRSLGRG